MTSGESSKRHIEVGLKGIVEHHQMEVQTLQALRISEMNARKESEVEIDKLKESLARLEMEKCTGVKGTNLKSKMDEVAGRRDDTNEPGPSGRKNKEKSVPNPAMQAVDKDAFAVANRRDLRGKNKELIMSICKNEGVVYTMLEPTKEAIVHARLAKAFGVEPGKNDKGKGVLPVEVSDDGNESNVREDHDDETVS
ncbi:hypothetical protein CBR_g52602 [Chara braunii]|uniref:Uncharacterized protein n=1 Tax=Chara braunii TaxID=69332 RepID=A0A388MAH1_CHABU|nr:hypothetical protein CBR_g52602 [Chara braunii]|eukprot:GBG91568.1 hypothetical protein CBR_g52602 [Chara braunii]